MRRCFAISLFLFAALFAHAQAPSPSGYFSLPTQNCLAKVSSYIGGYPVVSCSGLTDDSTSLLYNGKPVGSGASSVASVTGASAEYPMLDGTGTTVFDVSGNGNNAHFDSGSNSPSWYSYGVALNDTGVNNTPHQDIITPLTNWGTAYIAHCTPNLVQNTNVGQNNTPAVIYPTLVGPTSGSSGGVLILAATTYNNHLLTVQPAEFSLASNSQQTIGPGTHGGCHVYAFSAGSPDHITVDGNEMNPYWNQDSTASEIAVTGGTYEIGSGGNSQDGNGLRGVVTYAVFFPSAHSPAQMQQESAYIQSKLSTRAAFPHWPVFTTSTTPQVIAVGDSLTATYGGSTQWSTALSLNTGYNVSNYGIFGMEARDICEMSEQRWVQQIVPGRTVVHLWAGTNDVSNGFQPAETFESLSLCAQKAHKYGARVIVGTMISRTGQDSNKDALNALIRSGYKQAGFDYLNDIAEVPALGADGANTNTACFQSDDTHLVGPGAGTCATIGTTALSGYGVVAALTSNAINTMDGSSQSAPDQTASNAFVAAYANNYVIQTPTAAATYSLVDCQGQSSPRTLVNGSASFAITVSAINGQTITGSNTVGANVSAEFMPVLTSNTAGGCFWLRVR